MPLANRLAVPDGTQAILWDMDGVLIDSLGLDYTVCTGLLRAHCGRDIDIPAAVIREGFPLSPRDFWLFILARLQIGMDTGALEGIVAAYERERQEATFPVLAGVVEVLAAARERGLRQAVVSNNPQQALLAILERSGIAGWFDAMVGNDLGTLRKKPAPDTYLHAAALLGVDIGRCVVVEDSPLGLEAGWLAGAHTVGVATGGTGLRELERCGRAAVCYGGFDERKLAIAFGDVRAKRLVTPNDFVSHMVEHIAWRLGLAIDLAWPDTDWEALGHRLGREIGTFAPLRRQAAALGMIDDGSAEVLIDLDGRPELAFDAIANTDLDWFLSLRCEQLDSGRPLVALLRGLAGGLGALVRVRVCSVEDPHHAWEGVFRSVGIALARLFQPVAPAPAIARPVPAGERVAASQGQGRIDILEGSPSHAGVVRETAESIVRITVGLARNPSLRCDLSVADSIDVGTFPRLLERLTTAAGFDLSVSFVATKLNSSHVVLEDIGLVLGRALLEIFQRRMEETGAHGAGSSVRTAEHYATDSSVQVGLSIEGRKFVKFLPFSGSFKSLRRRFLIGPTILGTTRAEDLDDFLDGLAGGLACSIMVHLRDYSDPEAAWLLLFEQLGFALRECFEFNPYRKGVPAGVKATLV